VRNRIGRGLVMVNGCFDPFHYGHLLHLYAARAHGRWLVVALTGDAYVNKGPGRPAFPVEQRKAVLEGLRCVDEVIVSDAPTPAALIQQLRPEVYAKGCDYAGADIAEAAIVEAYGGRVVFTETPKFSSTALLSAFPDGLYPRGLT
jgi:D-beta-D-heptose 7-phosphate kinase/D-beta-D-heptose 1-phosphate adenosyltransferase